MQDMRTCMHDPVKLQTNDSGMKFILLKVLRPSGPNYWKMLNGYLMFSVKNFVQNVKLIESWGKNLAPLHFVISKS